MSRGRSPDAGVVFFALMVYGEGDGAVVVTLTVPSADRSCFVVASPPEGDGSGAAVEGEPGIAELRCQSATNGASPRLMAE